MITKTAKKGSQIEMVSLDMLVPEDHLLRKIDEHIDFSFIYDLVEEKYSLDNGRPSIDPVTLIKIPVIEHTGQHMLRHTFATRCIEAGVSPLVLKNWLGHTNIHITLDTYSDVFARMNAGSIALLDRYMESIGPVLEEDADLDSVHDTAVIDNNWNTSAGICSASCGNGKTLGFCKEPKVRCR